MISGSTASLRPRGVGRYFSAAFLAFWLAGWLVGEAAALALLGGIAAFTVGLWQEPPAWIYDATTGGPAALLVLFLLVWITFWTIGGLAALTHLLRSLAGEDSIAIVGSGFELTRRAGPFRKRHTFDRADIRRIRTRPSDKAIVVDTSRGTQVLTDFGSPAERDEIRAWLIERVGIAANDANPAGALPAAWEMTRHGDAARLRKVQPRVRVVRSVLAWLMAGAVAVGWFAARGPESVVGNPAALALTVLMACTAALSTWGRREWIARRGELIFHSCIGPWTKEHSFTVARLDVTHETDSDNDSHYRLAVLSGDDRRVVHSQLHDAVEVVDLGRWLACHTGFPLVLPRELRPAEPTGDRPPSVDASS